MIDETASQSSAGTTGPGEGSAETTVAFCQQCGRPLTAATRRQVGTGIFCEPCAIARQAAGWAPVNPGAVPYAPDTPGAGEPNPALAGFLGLIPGVGAMYNGQYAKGVIHLIVFVVLVSLADNLNWVLWWLVWGWIFYQAFEAYHTARARRDGMPLPDPFGWNELGERLGFTRPTTARPPRPSRVTGFQPAAPPGATGTAAPVPPPAPMGTAVPATPPVANYAGPYIPPPADASASTVYGHVPYSATYTGAGGASVPPAGMGQPPVVTATHTFPVGAIWLIALGILFLLGNILPAWHLTGRWLVPILLAVIAFWTGSRRLVTLQHMPAYRMSGVGPSLAGALLGPIMLLTLAILLAMQAAYWIPLKHSWPAILIVWGALLLAERAQAPTAPLTAAAGPEPVSNPIPPAADPSSR